VDELDGKIIVGLRTGSIVELMGRQKRVVMESHSDGEVWGLDIHFGNPSVLITTGDDNKVKVWDALQRKCVKTGILDLEVGPKRKPG
jgi:WD40 repeat protein